MVVSGRIILNSIEIVEAQNFYASKENLQFDDPINDQENRKQWRLYRVTETHTLAPKTRKAVKTLFQVPTAFLVPSKLIFLI